ncbi:MAG: YaiO family outer membrane beta-barrel protein [Fibrobacterota bacterium]|nr:YaiO family outer membrane beta-barrel protein [Fibrobacterota bacterium]QQS07520.1 MAG: YaiO family outer membrane beta-barrel protein [Fibrobacterota bacterium]
MIALATLALAALTGSPEGPSVSASAAFARLDAPQGAPNWSEFSGGLAWKAARWNTGVSATMVRRWDLDDLQGEFQAGHKLSESVSWEATASLGGQERFLPSWATSAALVKTLPQGWVGTVGLRLADYREWKVFVPKILCERYIRAWRLGAGTALPWPQGMEPTLDVRVLGGWDWSDRGGIGIDASYAREAERDGNVLLDRRSTSTTLSVRQELGARVIVRPAISWTRLETVHDRLEVRLAIQCGIGG